jgi:hypothetical protein
MSMLVLASAGLLGIAGMAFPVETGEMKRDGPWIFTEQIDGGEGRHRYMAATPAAEDGDAWLLLACDGVRVTASVMFSAGPAYVVRSPPQLVLRSDAFPIISVVAQLVQKNQLSIDADTTRHLMPLFFDSGKITISMREKAGAIHEYTFTLQPNGSALAEIERHCVYPEN